MDDIVVASIVNEIARRTKHQLELLAQAKARGDADPVAALEQPGSEPVTQDLLNRLPLDTKVRIGITVTPPDGIERPYVIAIDRRRLTIRPEESSDNTPAH